MNAADSLAWGELLIWQGNGEQLQFYSVRSWMDKRLDADLLSVTETARWRRKPKTRTLTIRTWRSKRGQCATHNSDTNIAAMPDGWTLIDAHTIEVEL